MFKLSTSLYTCPHPCPHGCARNTALVAAAAAFMASKNGRQTAFMAPTELLAQQHKKTLDNLLLPLGIKTVLITGSQTAKERRIAAEALKNSEYDIAVGTHALGRT